MGHEHERGRRQRLLEARAEAAVAARPQLQRTHGRGRQRRGRPGDRVAVYDSYGEGGWLEAGGTSVAAPIIAGVFALAGNAATIPSNAKYIYSHSANLFDVTTGSNGSCAGSYFCTAKPGYDGPTGLGTPNGIAAF